MKEEILRAIATLRHISDIETTKKYEEFHKIERLNYDLLTSIEALQEQLDRVEGCDKCREPKCSSCKYHYKECVYSELENTCFDSKNSVKPNYKRYNCKYNFCPNCGRKLKNESEE